MENLKVTLHFDRGTPVILNRFTTIESILLASYYGYKAKRGERLPFDPEHKSVNFIHKEKGVFSGSIWYIEPSDNIYLDFHTIIKNPEYRKIFDMTATKASGNPQMKMAQISEELLILPKIHFYVKGSKAHIETLLQSEVSQIGQKQRLGFGKIESVEVEVIDEDKGFKLDEYTPSKPLPASDFEVKSKKVAFFRRTAPYWLKEDREPCYMPTSSLYEMRDDTFDDKSYKVKEQSYITNTEFIYNEAKRIEKSNFIPFEMKIEAKKSEDFYYGVSDTPKQCVFSGQRGVEGVHGKDLQRFMKKWKSRFSDYDYMQRGHFISKETLWCIDNLSKIGYALIEKGNDWVYLQGKHKKEGSEIKDYLLNHKKFKLPFSINLKDTKNAQHISFKGSVSISNAFYYLQYGNNTLQIDTQLLRMAIKELASIIKKNDNIFKRDLCGHFKENPYHVLFSSKTDKEKEIIMQFHRKYNRDIRHILYVVALS